jgi:hypothetical protein
MSKNLIFDSNLKPRIGRLTLRGLNHPNAGEYDSQRRSLYLLQVSTMQKPDPRPLIFVKDRSEADLVKGRRRRRRSNEMGR